MSQEIMRKQIKESLKVLKESPNLFDSACAFFDTLGYRSDRRLGGQSGQPEEFTQNFQSLSGMPNTKTEKFFIQNIRTVQILFQVTEKEIKAETEQGELFEDNKFQTEDISSFVFLVADLKGEKYTRSDYATLAREISKRLPMPVFVLFRHNDFVSLAFADRRPSKKINSNRDVLGKVSLLHEIDCRDPHAGHRNILVALSLSESLKRITQKQERRSFDTLHKALLSELDTEELNKRFYGEIFKWFQWAVDETEFPDEKEGIKENHVIRLITRMLFVWFMKEKGLVADELFIKVKMEKLLKSFGDDGSDYYRAVLQNLFFATLNTEIGKRAFSSRERKTHRNFSLYRYEDLIQDQEKFLSLMKQTPFINGGLFDCLDSEQATGTGGYRVDCFTDNKTHRKDLLVPDKLFFDQSQGLLPLFQRYKFTVEESTPIEQEVALDPELLGKVFENLLAAYNPETSKTARKQTGSYYTPRAVVDYMVDESLLAYLGGKVAPSKGTLKNWQKRLCYLMDYTDAFDDVSKLFRLQEREELVQAIADIKVLDPAVGSGAFPMGVLHKLVLVLSRLDKKNTFWQKVQKKRAIKKTELAYENQDNIKRKVQVAEIQDTFTRYSSDFGRKLFLIQNSIFGVDIQPVACQIAKLRFFISLAIEQHTNDDSNNNYGIKPLPNLETRFVAANTLVGIAPKGAHPTMVSPKVKEIEEELGDIREKHFNAGTRNQKLNLTSQFKRKQKELSDELKNRGFEGHVANKVAIWDPFDQSSKADWFDSEWMFGEKDGFDIVISNPPYIKVNLLSKEMRQYLFSKFETCEKRTDIYIAFIEKALSLLSANGALTFIIPASFSNQKYGEKLRSLLIGDYYIEEILNASSFRIFEATVFNIIIRISKSQKKGETRLKNYSSIQDFIKQGDNGFTVNQKEFLEMKDSRFETREHVFKTLQIKQKIWNRSIPLKDILYVAYGARLNHKSKDVNKSKYISKQYLPGFKPFIEGRDIDRYFFTSSKWLNYQPKQHYNPMFPALFESEKLMLIRIVSKRLRFAYDNKGYYNSHTVINCVRLDLLVNEKYKPLVSTLRKSKISLVEKFNYIFLLSILNSSLINWYFFSFISDSLNCYPDDVRALPIPNASKSKQSSLIRLVEDVMVKKQSVKDRSKLERKIDNLVYKLYGLSKKEILMIEEIATKMEK